MKFLNCALAATAFLLTNGMETEDKAEENITEIIQQNRLQKDADEKKAIDDGMKELETRQIEIVTGSENVVTTLNNATYLAGMSDFVFGLIQDNPEKQDMDKAPEHVPLYCEKHFPIVNENDKLYQLCVLVAQSNGKINLTQGDRVLDAKAMKIVLEFSELHAGVGPLAVDGSTFLQKPMVNNKLACDGNAAACTAADLQIATDIWSKVEAESNDENTKEGATLINHVITAATFLHMPGLTQLSAGKIAEFVAATDKSVFEQYAKDHPAKKEEQKKEDVQEEKKDIISIE